jgi:cell division septation protein DedD
VSELTHHDADDGFHEIQLSGKQLVFLFMATTVVAVLVFLCGVQVGRNVKTDRTAADGTEAAVAVPPPPAASPSQPVASSGPPAAEPPAPPPDELSYAKRLQSDSTPAEKLKPQPDQRAARPPAPAPAAAKPQPKTDTASGARPGAWIVQVISLQDRGAAATIAKRLSGKGYPAFVLDPAPGAPRIYRVQVGGYADKGDAEQASRRLEKDEQFKPLVRSR